MSLLRLIVCVCAALSVCQAQLCVLLSPKPTSQLVAQCSLQQQPAHCGVESSASAAQLHIGSDLSVSLLKLKDLFYSESPGTIELFLVDNEGNRELLFSFTDLQTGDLWFKFLSLPIASSKATGRYALQAVYRSNHPTAPQPSYHCLNVQLCSADESPAGTDSIEEATWLEEVPAEDKSEATLVEVASTFEDITALFAAGDLAPNSQDEDEASESNDESIEASSPLPLYPSSQPAAVFEDVFAASAAREQLETTRGEAVAISAQPTQEEDAEEADTEAKQSDEEDSDVGSPFLSN